MRCAIVHYWLLGARGGEKVVEALCHLLPEADIFTLFYDVEKVSETIRSHRVTASFLNHFQRSYRSLLPLMPIALEQFDLRPYDLVISSESGPAKGVITRSQTRHICYCHSPMRYLWDLYPAYVNEWTRSTLKRLFMRPLTHYLRLWDYASAARVDDFIANSKNVQTRIWKTYRREARVIYPPVNVGSFSHQLPSNYYLVVSELVSYKRIIDAVQCCSRTGRRLKIVGGGPEYSALRNQANSNIEFCGRVSDYELCELYARCRAVLIPGEEDFGIVAVEAMASGKPIISIARGGVLESIPPHPFAAFLYNEPGAQGLHSALLDFEKNEHLIAPEPLQAYAARFSPQRFQAEMTEVLSTQIYPQLRFAAAAIA